MRYSASEKFEIIELVERSSLSIRRTLAPIGIPRSTFYDWYSRYQEGGIEALEDEPCLHFGIGEASIDLLVELVDDPGRCPCRCAEAEIAARLIARHEFAHGRNVRQRVRARGRAHRKRTQPARPNVLDQARHRIETDLHLSGEKID